MQKIYYDAAQKLEIVSLNGAMTLQDVNQKYAPQGGIANFKDITAERAQKVKDEQAAVAAKSGSEQKIAERMREKVVAELIAEGKLPAGYT